MKSMLATLIECDGARGRILIPLEGTSSTPLRLIRYGKLYELAPKTWDFSDLDHQKAEYTEAEPALVLDVSKLYFLSPAYFKQEKRA